MRNQRGWHWKRRFSGLAFRISFIVFVATLFTSLVITWVSVHSIGMSLRGQLDQKFPELLEHTSSRLSLWYQQREHEVRAFARSQILLEGLHVRDDATREEASWYLSYVLEQFPQYATLLLLDAEGEPLLRAGEAPELDPSLRAFLDDRDQTGVSRLYYIQGRRVQLVSEPLENAQGERIATLHAVLKIETLEPLLRQPEIAGGTTLQLHDDTGRVLGEASALLPHGVPPEVFAKGMAPEIVVAESASGERIAVSALRLPRFGWTLVAVENYDTAFAPVRASLRRTLGINLLAVLLSSAGAFAFASWRVRPILALAEGARRISEGETAAEVPDSGSGDEIQFLARTFNQMSARLHQSRLQLESRNEELKSANETLEQLSITDSLTRLHNHRFFQDQFAREAKRVERTGSPLGLVLIDIDDFKSLNDRLGHAAGDAVLARVAAVMSAVLRDTDLLCRYGGEEFAVLLPQTGLTGAVSLAEKIRGAVAESEYAIVGPDGPIHISVSIGVAGFAHSTEATFNEADRALYDAKDAGVLEHARDGLRLADRHRHRIDVELPDHRLCDSLAEGLHELVLVVAGDVLDHLEDALVVDRLPDPVATARPMEVAFDLDVEGHGSSHLALGGGDTESCGDLDPLEKNRIDHDLPPRRRGSRPPARTVSESPGLASRPVPGASLRLTALDVAPWRIEAPGFSGRQPWISQRFRRERRPISFLRSGACRWPSWRGADRSCATWKVASSWT